VGGLEPGKVKAKACGTLFDFEKGKGQSNINVAKKKKTKARESSTIYTL
jgi:hypothetical protein